MTARARCLQCARGLSRSGSRKRPHYGTANKFCSEFCQRRYYGEMPDAIAQGLGIPFPPGSAEEIPVPPIPAPEQPNPAVIRFHGCQNRLPEGHDAYPVVDRIGADLRVIRCKDDIQWILQRRSSGQWRALGYFRNKDVLAERIVALGALAAEVTS
jgi:hypothetical protein